MLGIGASWRGNTSLVVRYPFFWKALQCRIKGAELTFPWPDEPQVFIGLALRIVRFGLSMLVARPRCIISAQEFYHIDDNVMRQILDEVKARWPEYDVIGNGVIEL